MPIIRTLRLSFPIPIRQNEIPLFRGAIIAMAGPDEVLFHNHVGEGFRYRYPLVQYKRIGGEAAVLFVGEGIDEAGALFNRLTGTLTLGDRVVACQLGHADAQRTNVQLWQESFTYSLRKYLALNQDNLLRYEQAQSLAERCEMLEHIIVGNILSFAKSLGIYFDGEVKVSIQQLDGPRPYRFKQVRMLGFDLQFTCNVSLPDYIGLGKGASLGFGVVKRLRHPLGTIRQSRPDDAAMENQ